ncbi:MAG TPA: dTMP kinase [Oligoflexia bacterium]|nr:dTMP kinase [Oligoflexia bacterium]HMP26811.1 dTMP kinase [Oligoflexia bacterium]
MLIDIKSSPLTISKPTFIVFEGLNGSGKSSAIQHVAKLLKEKSTPYFLTGEPGGSKLGTKLRELLLASNEKFSKLAEIFLFLADRAEHVEQIIEPKLASGNWVISDRYYYSTIAFQGFGRGFDPIKLKELNLIAIKNRVPDLVILLDIDPQTGLERNLAAKKSIKQGEDKFETELLEFHQKVREGYLKMASTYPEKFVLIDASKTKNEVLAEITDLFSKILNQKIK